MKKNILIILFSIILFSSFKLNKITKVEGYIKSYGNVPFNYPAIETDDHKLIKFRDGKYSKETLLSYQGYLLEITGRIQKEKIGKNVEYFIDVDDIEIILQ